MPITFTSFRMKLVFIETGLPAVASSDIDVTTTTGKQMYHCKLPSNSTLA